MKKPIYIIFLLISVLITSLAISYADDDFEFPEDITELEIMLEEAEAVGDTKLINKLNKRINHQKWKEEKESKNAIKDGIEEQLEEAESNGDIDLVKELKLQLKLAVRDSIRTKFLKNKDGKMPFGLVKPFKDEKRNEFSKVEWFEKKQEFFQGHSNDKRIQQLQKQIEKFKNMEEKKKNKSNKGVGNGN